MKFTGERVVPSNMAGNIDTYQQHLIRYVWALEYVANKTVLDAACGTGYGTSLMQTVAQDVEGWDVDPQTLRYAKREYPKSFFMQVDLNQPLPNNKKFDVAVTFETIEHLDAPVLFINELRSLSQTVIGSIPIECPTPYHKQVWTYQQIIEFLNSLKPKTLDLWYQDHMNIYSLSSPRRDGMILFRIT